jgi:hypothetical protein
MWLIRLSDYSKNLFWRNKIKSFIEKLVNFKCIRIRIFANEYLENLKYFKIQIFQWTFLYNFNIKRIRDLRNKNTKKLFICIKPSPKIQFQNTQKNNNWFHTFFRTFSSSSLWPYLKSKWNYSLESS